MGARTASIDLDGGETVTCTYQGASNCQSAAVALVGPTVLPGIQTYRSETMLTTSGEIVVSGGADISFEAHDGISFGSGFRVVDTAVLAARITVVNCGVATPARESHQ